MLSPKPRIPGIASQWRREAMKNQVHIQRALWYGCPAAGLESKAEQTQGGSSTGEEHGHTLSTWSLLRRRVLQVLHPNPARQTLHPFPVRGADGAPGGGFPLGWVCSSHMQPLQTQTALSPAGAEQVGLFIWEELICCRSIIFPPKPCAARCLDHFSLST